MLTGREGGRRKRRRVEEETKPDPQLASKAVYSILHVLLVLQISKC